MLYESRIRAYGGRYRAQAIEAACPLVLAAGRAGGKPDGQRHRGEYDACRQAEPRAHRLPDGTSLD
ncbi:MAG: hypothetical protein ACRDL4_17525, partial [Thermoleophilaceae bacterium]